MHGDLCGSWGKMRIVSYLFQVDGRVHFLEAEAPPGDSWKQNSKFQYGSGR